jgi:hypothetical protein
MLIRALIRIGDAMAVARRRHDGGRLMKKSLLAFFLLALSVTAVGAVEMKDLAPCRPAAARFCDRSGGMTWSNLLRCGATLAAHSFHIGNACRDVLKRYGEL